MGLYEKDPALTKAVALALTRLARDLLTMIQEEEAARYLGMAIDAILKRRADPQPQSH